MQDYTPEQIQEHFEQLPDDLKQVISSPQIHKSIQDIGSSHNLMLDQVEDLVDQVGLVLLGLAKSGNFTADIKNRLVINEVDARAITDELNNEVFSKIRSSLQDLANDSDSESPTQIYHTEKEAIGRAGGFEIEHHPEIADNGPSKVPNYGGFTPKPPSQPSPSVPPPAPFKAPEPKTESKTEPLVDQLLRGTASLPQDKVTKEPETPKYTPPKPISFGTPKPPAPPIPPTPTPQAQPPKNLPTSDPYRELPQ